MDEVDLSIENYEELFGVGHNDPEHLFAKDGIDSLFGGAESSCAGKVRRHLPSLNFIVDMIDFISFIFK